MIYSGMRPMKMESGTKCETKVSNIELMSAEADKETGEIEWVSDMAMTQKEQEEIYDRLDEHGFYRLPTSFEIRDYDIMEDFVDMLSGAAHDRLSSAIQGRGAFRRFKDTVIKMGIDQEWYDFQADAYKRKAIRWCEDNGIEYEK